MVDPQQVKEEIESLPTKLRDILRIEATDRGTVRLFEYESSHDRIMELMEVYEPLRKLDYVEKHGKGIKKNLEIVEYRILTYEMDEEDVEELLETLESVWDDREELDLGHIM